MVSVVFLIKTSSNQVTSSRLVLVNNLEDVGVAGDVGDKMGGMVGGDNGESEGDVYTLRGVTEALYCFRGWGKNIKRKSRVRFQFCPKNTLLYCCVCESLVGC